MKTTYSKLLLLTTLATLLASCAGVKQFKEDIKQPLLPDPPQTAMADGAVLNSGNIDFGKQYKTFMNPDLDPWQEFNRKSYYLNLDILDAYILRPLAIANGKLIAPDIREKLSNFANYLNEPVNFVSNLATLQPKAAGKNIARILINGIFGLGFVDWATAMGIDNNENNFDYVLAYYNVKPGNYLMIPGLGPTNVRSLVAKTGIQNATTSIAYNAVINGISWVTMPMSLYSVINLRTNLMAQEAMLKNSPDSYLFAKSAYIQNYNYSQAKALNISEPQPSTAGFDFDLE